MVRVAVKVKPNSKQNMVEATGEKSYTVRVKEKALEGRANEAAIELLSEYLHIPKNRFRIIKGQKARNKIIEFF